MIHILPITSILFIFGFQLQKLYAAKTVTITDIDAFSEQVSCVQQCLYGSSGDKLNKYLGCTYPYVEECYCRPSFESVASSFLTSCVVKSCTISVDNAQRAVSVYNHYCASAQVGPALSPATTTSPGSSIPEPSSTVLVMVTVTSPPSPTSASTSTSWTGGEFLRNSILIGIMVALHLGPLAG